MKDLTQVSKDYLTLMNGCEVQSLNYEGCVYIKGNVVYLEGEPVDTLDTEDKISDLWDEYREGEGLI